MLLADPRNAERFAFLDDLQAWMSSTKSFLQWVNAAREVATKSLRPPTAHDSDHFITLSATRGGIVFIRDT